MNESTLNNLCAHLICKGYDIVESGYINKTINKALVEAGVEPIPEQFFIYIEINDDKQNDIFNIIEKLSEDVWEVCPRGTVDFNIIRKEQGFSVRITEVGKK